VEDPSTSRTRRALLAGVPLLVVSQLLGHSSIAITANIYSHLDPRQGQEAVRSAAALVPWTRTAAEGT
jgi:integrase